MKFEISNQVLYNADWREAFASLPDASVDLLLTDPPYGITAIAWDKKIDWPAFWAEAHRVCKPAAPLVVFASGKFVPELLNSNLNYFRYEHPFVGSGTTIVASLISGRHGIGCDLSKDYFKTAKQRLIETEAAIS